MRLKVMVTGYWRWQRYNCMIAVLLLLLHVVKHLVTSDLTVSLRKKKNRVIYSLFLCALGKVFGNYAVTLLDQEITVSQLLHIHIRRH